MTSRRSFLLRIDPEVLDAVQRWANDDLRSLNGQVEFLLRAALRQAGRAQRSAAPDAPASPGHADAPPSPSHDPESP
jgi:hypothetical protein